MWGVPPTCALKASCESCVLLLAPAGVLLVAAVEGWLSIMAPHQQQQQVVVVVVVVVEG
jgi:hypothetical protein